MGTYLGVIADTGERADFWALMRAHRVQQLIGEVPPRVLIDCWEKGWPAFDAAPRLARELSRALARPCIAVAAQTISSVLDVRAFDGGAEIRTLLHCDPEGWTRVEGAAQPWEAAMLFDDAAEPDEASAEDLERYRSARKAGQPAQVLDLLQPDHLGPVERLCAHFGLDPRRPSARWRKPSLLSRFFRR
jgi:hypothetical protein